MIQELIQIGFNEPEAKIYTACLEIGKASISQIVDKSGMNKKACYHALQKLITDGLVAAQGDKKKNFCITDIEIIEERLQQRLNRFHSILPELYASMNRATSSRSVAAYHNPDSIRNAFKYQMRREKNDSALLVIESAQFHFIDFMRRGANGSAFDIYERTRINRGVGLKLLFIDDPMNLKNLEFEFKHQRPNREASRSIMSSTANTLEGMYVWNDRVFLLDEHADQSVVLVELANKEIRQGFVSYFESLWQNAQKIE